MDPASATVAFVGFAASLATVAAVVVDSSRTLHDVYKSVKNAPREIQRMDQKSKRLHKMILEVQRMSEDLHDGEPPPFIHEFWLEHAGEIHHDFVVFKKKIENLHAGISKNTSKRKHIIMRIQTFFSEREVRKYEEQLSEHMQTIGILLNMLSQYVCPIVIASH
jgi:hypothetical protein